MILAKKAELTFALFNKFNNTILLCVKRVFMWYLPYT